MKGNILPITTLLSIPKKQRKRAVEWFIEDNKDDITFITNKGYTIYVCKLKSDYFLARSVDKNELMTAGRTGNKKIDIDEYIKNIDGYDGYKIVKEIKGVK